MIWTSVDIVQWRICVSRSLNDLTTFIFVKTCGWGLGKSLGFSCKWCISQQIKRLLSLNRFLHAISDWVKLNMPKSYLHFKCLSYIYIYIYCSQRSWRGGILDSPCPSVRPSVCRRHGFRSISQVCFGISISNFICMLMVAIGRSLLIFSDVTFKMAAWRPYWIFWFPDSNYTLALNINFKLQRHNTYVYG